MSELMIAGLALAMGFGAWVYSRMVVAVATATQRGEDA
jgi:hypothetical protein